jgi:hypothetical protein
MCIGDDFCYIFTLAREPDPYAWSVAYIRPADVAGGITSTFMYTVSILGYFVVKVKLIEKSCL